MQIPAVAFGPQWLLDEIEKHVATRRRHADSHTPIGELDLPDAISRATEYLASRAEPAVEGAGGDFATYRVAARLKDYGISEHVAVDLLLDHWNEHCAPPWPPEELERKVANAYLYGQNPPGWSSPEAEFDAVGDDVGLRELFGLARSDMGIPISGQRGPASPLPLIHYRDVELVDIDFLVDGVIPTGGLIVVYGNSNRGKTFVALDMAFSVAAGRPWAGHDVDVPGPVVYVSMEGAAGMRKRIKALQAAYGTDARPLYLIPAQVDLAKAAEPVKALVAACREVERLEGRPPAMIVLDTLARAIAGGDENSPVDMGNLVRRTQDLQAATGAAVLLIHHTGKDEARGARGHSLLRAATDTEIAVEEGGVVRVTKQRDEEFAKPVQFDLKGWDLGVGRKGRPVTSCTVTWRSVAEIEFEEGMLSPDQEAILEVASAMIEEERERLAGAGGDPSEVCQKEIGIKGSDLVDEVIKRTRCGEIGLSVSVKTDATAKRSVRRLRTDLVNYGQLVSKNNLLWLQRVRTPADTADKGGQRRTRGPEPGADKADNTL